jgi:hypothetical protein
VNVKAEEDIGSEEEEHTDIKDEEGIYSEEEEDAKEYKEIEVQEEVSCDDIAEWPLKLVHAVSLSSTRRTTALW